MSFVHSTIVGHFDPFTLNASDRGVSRPIDLVAARSLFSEFPEHVSSRVEFIDGYAECWWADHSMRVSEAVSKFAYRLAESQNCIAAETPTCIIGFPESARQQQSEAWQRWREENPPVERKPLPPPLFNPPEPGPCPYCGQPLRTAIARQCRLCKMNWHDPTNVFRRDTKRG